MGRPFSGACFLVKAVLVGWLPVPGSSSLMASRTRDNVLISRLKTPLLQLAVTRTHACTIGIPMILGLRTQVTGIVRKHTQCLKGVIRIGLWIKIHPAKRAGSNPMTIVMFVLPIVILCVLWNCFRIFACVQSDLALFNGLASRSRPTRSTDL